MNDSHPKLLVLHESDNVYVVLCAINSGPVMATDGAVVQVQSAATLGHKIARRDIAAGTPILKYGVSIGQATRAILAGEHVHVHNIKSNYTATHSLEETAAGEADA